MTYLKAYIKNAVAEMKREASIVRFWEGYIVLAQCERDYKVKTMKISQGDTAGFLAIERVLDPNCLNG